MTEQTVTIYRKPAKEWRLIFSAVGMTLLSLFVGWIGWTDGRLFLLFIGGIGSLFFGFGMIYITKASLTKQELLKLTPEGFYDNTTALSIKNLLIYWNEIERIDQVEINGNPFLSVYLIDPKRYLGGLKASQKKLIALNGNLGYGEINIDTQQAKDWTVEELFAEMTRYRQQAKSLINN